MKLHINAVMQKILQKSFNQLADFLKTDSVIGGAYTGRGLISEGSFYENDDSTRRGLN